jgi:hypothetical protein
LLPADAYILFVTQKEKEGAILQQQESILYITIKLYYGENSNFLSTLLYVANILRM